MSFVFPSRISAASGQKRLTHQAVLTLPRLATLFFLSVVFTVQFALGEEVPMQTARNQNAASVVRSLVISGNDSFPEAQLRSLMQTDVWGTYDEAVLKQDFDAIVRFYHAEGFLFARVPVEKLAVKQFGDGVYIRFEIDEGIIGKITLDGNTKTRDAVILRELLFAVGDVYTEADKEESEQILRRKRYIGDPSIEAHWDAFSQTVSVHVTVKDLWTLLGALEPNFNSQRGYFLARVRESNLSGTGHATQVSYERISEVDEKTRSLFRGQYELPRLFNSHWNFDGEYTQERIGDSWRVLLERPQYSLKSRWSARFQLLEAIDTLSWFEGATRTDTFERHHRGASGRIRRYFGDRQRQTYIGLWATARRSTYELVEKNGISAAALRNRDIKRFGITVGRQHVAYHKTRFLKRMGQTENFFIGSQYGLSLGHASPLYGSDREESYAELALGNGWLRGQRLFGTTTVAVNANFTSRIERSIIEARTTLFYTDVFNTGDIYTLEDGFREDGLFDFHQTFVAQFKTAMQFGWHGESQVILGAATGLRGYAYREFNGEKMMLLRLESRTVFGGTVFRKIDEALAAVATFCAQPFTDSPVSLGLVLSGTAFADIGYIWNGQQTFNIGEPKRSLGFGIRGSFSQVGGTGIIRVECAFPLDSSTSNGFSPTLFYGLERAF